MYSKSLLFSQLVSIIILSGATGCSGGGGKAPTTPPDGNGQSPKPPNPIDQGIREIAGWDQVKFAVYPEGGSFDFPGGRMIVPAGAVPEARMFSVARAPWDKKHYFFQPGGFKFAGAVRVQLNNPDIQADENPYTAVYQYRAAFPDEPNAFGGFIFDVIESIAISDGALSFIMDTCSTIRVTKYVSSPSGWPAPWHSVLPTGMMIRSLVLSRSLIWVMFMVWR